jgi:hypothetical protein
MATGNITYSNQTTRNAAVTAINNVLASYPEVTGTASAFPAGVATSGTTVLTFSLSVPDSTDIEAFRVAMLTAWAQGTRSTVHTAFVRMP